MCNGWIKLHRKILDWEWYTSPTTVHLFLYFLLKANTEDKQWKGIIIKRGQLVTSMSVVCDETGLTAREYRTSMKRLKTTSEVTSKTTNKYTLVTICKYESYQLTKQDSDKQNDKQGDNQKTNKGQRLKNNKNIRSKEIIKKENIVKEKSEVAPIVATQKSESVAERKEKFYQSLVPYVAKYGREMVRAFYDYWTELTPGGRKMRMEQQSVFEIPKRLATWKRNEMKYDTNHNRNSQSSYSAKAERDAEFFAHIREKLARPDTDAEDLPYALQDG